MKSALTDNTRRAYGSAIAHYLSWGGLLPATEKEIKDYLMTFSRSHSLSTLAIRRAAISSWHVLHGFPDPTSTPRIQELFKAIKLPLYKSKENAEALSIGDLKLISRTLLKTDGLSAKRDRAILLISFFGAIVRSELVSLKVSDLKWHKSGLLITIPGSKADLQGNRTAKAIIYCDEELCPILALKDWIEAAAIKEGYIFRAINRWGAVSIKGLSPEVINIIIAKLGYTEGLQ